MPANAEQQLFELFVHLILIFRDAEIRDLALFMNFNQTQLVVADPKSGKEDEWENEAATNNDDNTTILPSVTIELLMQGPAQLPAINLGMAAPVPFKVWAKGNRPSPSFFSCGRYRMCNRLA